MMGIILTGFGILYFIATIVSYIILIIIFRIVGYFNEIKERKKFNKRFKYIKKD